MNFLRPTDYLKSVTSDNLNSIIDSDLTVLAQAELVAVEEMTSYLTQRFETEKVFAYTTEYDNSFTYDKDARVFSASTAGTYSYFFSNVTGNTGNDLTNDSYWTSGDNRSQMIVSYTVDIALYHIYSRVAPRQIPELRLMRYQNSIDWLNKVATSKITAPLPERTFSAQTGYSIRYGNATRQNNNFF